MPYIPAEYIPFLRGTDAGLRLALFFRLGGDDPLRLWLGTWRVRIDERWADENWLGVESTTDTGEIYRGAGRLLGFPDLEVSTNATAPRITIELSGIDPGNVALLDVDMPDVTGLPCFFGFTTLDYQFQPEFPIQKIWTGYADFLTDERKPDATPDKPWQWKMGLSMGSGDARRSKPLGTVFSDSQHRALYPTDAFFNRVIRYVQGLRIGWPV